MSDFLVNSNYKVARDFYRQGNYGAALNQLFGIPSNKIQRYDIQYLFGSIYLKMNDFENARKYLLGCTKSEHNNPKAYLKLVELYMKKKDFSEAERHAQRAEKLDAEGLAFLQVKSGLLFTQRKFEKCLPFYNKILEKQASKPQEQIATYLSKIKCLSNLGDFNEARKTLDIVKNIVQGNKEQKTQDEKVLKKLYEVEISLLKSEGDFEKARELVGQFRQIFHNDYQEWLFLISSVDYFAGDDDAVLNNCKEITEKGILAGVIPEKLTEFEYLAVFYAACALRNKQKIDQFTQLWDFLKAHKNYENEEYYLELAKYYYLLKDYDNCENYIQKSLRIKGNYVPALKFKIFFYHSQDRDEESNKLYIDNKKILEQYELKVSGNVFSVDSVSLQFSQLSVDPNNANKEGIQKKVTINRVFDKESAKNVIAVLGQGGFGIVTKEKVEGKILACKRLTFGDNVDPETQAKLTKDLRKEISAMVELEHKNVVKLEGFLQGKIMMELLEGGDLDGLLRKYPNVPIKLKIYFSLGIAEGLAYIHENEIIHGDMKPKNILLDKEYNPNEPDIYPCPKITDFGLSGAKRGKEGVEVKGVTMNYTAPEVFTEMEVSPKTDVFSFGLTMYEIFSGKIPFSGLNNQSIQNKIKAGELPDFDKDLKEKVCPPEIKDIIEKCCSFSPDDRDDMETVVGQIKDYYDTF